MGKLIDSQSSYRFWYFAFFSTVYECLELEPRIISKTDVAKAKSLLVVFPDMNMNFKLIKLLRKQTILYPSSTCLTIVLLQGPMESCLDSEAYISVNISVKIAQACVPKKVCIWKTDVVIKSYIFYF